MTNFNFIFMDECYDSRTGLFSLTAIVLPLQQYAVARSMFHDLLRRFEEFGLWTVNREFMEFHGSEMLSWISGASDDLKIEMFSRAVGIVERLGLRVCRVGTFRRSLPNGMRGDGTLLRLCWGEMLRVLEPVLETDFIIPVMDTADMPKTSAMSGLVTFMDQMRSIGNEEHLSIRNSDRIAGEVFYADSKFSFGIQLADLIGYLRLGTDRVSLGLEAKPSQFRAKLNTISARVDPYLVENRLSFSFQQLGSAVATQNAS